MTSYPSQSTSPVIREGLRVLLMDDDALVRETSAHLLSYLGCNIETAGEGKEALRLFSTAKKESRPFHLVISDIRVNRGMNGLELARQIRAQDPNVAILLASGLSEYDFQDDQVKIFPVLPKPFTLEELQEAIRSLFPRTGTVSS